MNECQIEKGCGNVFADLGLENADALLAKAELVRTLHQLIRARRLKQVEVARLLGIDQPKVSALLRGKFSGYSFERLLRFLTALGQDVNISVWCTTSGHTQGHIKVAA